MSQGRRLRCRLGRHHFTSIPDDVRSRLKMTGMFAKRPPDWYAGRTCEPTCWYCGKDRA